MAGSYPADPAEVSINLPRRSAGSEMSPALGDAGCQVILTAGDFTELPAIMGPPVIL